MALERIDRIFDDGLGKEAAMEIEQDWVRKTTTCDCWSRARKRRDVLTSRAWAKTKRLMDCEMGRSSVGTLGMGDATAEAILAACSGIGNSRTLRSSSMIVA